MAAAGRRAVYGGGRPPEEGPPRLAPFIEQSRPPLHYFYHGKHCYTSRATQDHVFDFVKNGAHPLSENEFRTRREVEKLSGKQSFLNRPMNKAVFGPALFPFQPGPLEQFDNDLLLANAAAFPASEMYSRGSFRFRIRVRGKPAADGTLPLMRIRVGYFDLFANHFRTLDSVPPERTFRDGNAPPLDSFSTNDWYDCSGAFFIVLVENASRHENGLPKTPGHHRYALGNIHIGSYDEIYERARPPCRGRRSIPARWPWRASPSRARRATSIRCSSSSTSRSRPIRPA